MLCHVKVDRWKGREHSSLLQEEHRQGTRDLNFYTHHLELDEALEEALRRSAPEIHYSAQGIQYLSSAYISTLIRHGIEISLAHRGCPWENGYAERLIRTLKEEEVHLNDDEDIIEAKTRIGHFITQVYNQKRPHSALGYLTPIEFEKQYLS